MSYFKYDGSAAAETAAPTTSFFGTAGVVDTYVGTSAAEAFWGGDGDVMTGGLGDDTYYLKAPTDKVIELAGGGTDKIVAWTNVSLSDHPNIENLEVDGDKTYGAGDAGDNTMTGGAGADTFHSFSGAGIDRITDFTYAEGDRVQLDPGTHYTLSQVGADTIVDMGNGDEVILANVQLASLPADWIFGA